MSITLCWISFLSWDCQISHLPRGSINTPCGWALTCASRWNCVASRWCCATLATTGLRIFPLVLKRTLLKFGLKSMTCLTSGLKLQHGIALAGWNLLMSSLRESRVLQGMLYGGAGALAAGASGSGEGVLDHPGAGLSLENGSGTDSDTGNGNGNSDNSDTSSSHHGSGDGALIDQLRDIEAAVRPPLRRGLPLRIDMDGDDSSMHSSSTDCDLSLDESSDWQMQDSKTSHAVARLVLGLILLDHNGVDYYRWLLCHRSLFITASLVPSLHGALQWLSWDEIQIDSRKIGCEKDNAAAAAEFSYLIILILPACWFLLPVFLKGIVFSSWPWC